MSTEKLHGVVIDPHLQSRNVLRQAALATGRFGAIYPTSTYGGAEPYLNGADRLDTVFISKTFGTSTVAQIIVQSKETSQGQYCAYILVLKEKFSDENSELAWNTLLGADAVICEPYSVDSLDAITKLSLRVRLQRIEERQRKAFAIMITDIIQQLDLVACLRTNGCEIGTSMKMFRDKCSALHSLTPDQGQMYYEMVVDRFVEAPLPPRSFLTSRAAQYRGASRRVQRLLLEKGDMRRNDELKPEEPASVPLEKNEPEGPRIYRGSSLTANLSASRRSLRMGPGGQESEGAQPEGYEGPQQKTENKGSK